MSKKPDIAAKVGLSYTAAVLITMVPALLVVWPVSQILAIAMSAVSFFSLLVFISGLIIEYGTEDQEE